MCYNNRIIIVFITITRKTIFWEYFRAISDDEDDFCNTEIDAGSCLSSYVIFTVITLLGILLFCYSAKKYRTRVRGQALMYYM